MTRKQIQQEIKSITNQLIKKYRPQKIILFGSAARGQLTPNSDLDFCIIKSQVPKHSFRRQWQISDLVDINLPTDFAVYTPQEFQHQLNRRNPFFLTILNEGKTLYEKSPN